MIIGWSFWLGSKINMAFLPFEFQRMLTKWASCPDTTSVMAEGGNCAAIESSSPGHSNCPLLFVFIG